MPALPQHDTAPRQLSQVVATYVRELIISGRVRKGNFLRIESIATAMNISSTPVREGLLLLQLEGFVKLSPRRGFMVVGFSRQDVRDIFWAQAMLAGELAARAAEVITEGDCAQIRELMRVHKEAVAAGDEPRYTRLGHQFHRAINLAAKSPRLAIMLGTMTKQLPNSFYGKSGHRYAGLSPPHLRCSRRRQCRNGSIADERTYHQRRRHPCRASGRARDLGRGGRRGRNTGRALGPRRDSTPARVIARRLRARPAFEGRAVRRPRKCRCGHLPACGLRLRH
jgi:DNA-binding GntR family transcriptional regulator